MFETATIISTINISQFICITLRDETSHYFGGYYHVKVMAYCDVPLIEGFFGSNAEFMDAKSRIGESVRFERIMEKMAVPENEIEPVRKQLIDSFKETTLNYLAAHDFAGSFVRSSYLKLIKKTVRKTLPGI